MTLELFGFLSRLSFLSSASLLLGLMDDGVVGRDLKSRGSRHHRLEAGGVPKGCKTTLAPQKAFDMWATFGFIGPLTSERQIGQGVCLGADVVICCFLSSSSPNHVHRDVDSVIDGAPFEVPCLVFTECQILNLNQRLLVVWLLFILLVHNGCLLFIENLLIP